VELEGGDRGRTAGRGEQGPESTGGPAPDVAALPRLASIRGLRSPTPLPGPTRSQTGRRTLMKCSVRAFVSPWKRKRLLSIKMLQQRNEKRQKREKMGGGGISISFQGAKASTTAVLVLSNQAFELTVQPQVRRANKGWALTSRK
jgi:hypothetical protein